MLLHELLSEVVDDDLVQLSTAQLVVVSSSKSGVHATTASNDGGIGASATKVGDNDQLVGHDSLGTSVVGKDSSNGLVDELQDLKASSVGSGDQSLTLSILEVGGDGDNSGVDLLSKEISGRLLQTAEMAGCDLGDGDSVGGLAGGIADGESNGRVALLRVGRVVAGSGVYRLEAVEVRQHVRLVVIRTS